METEEEIILSTGDQQNIFGQLDRNLKKLEDHFKVSIVARGDRVLIRGDEGDIREADKVIKELLSLSRKGSPIDDQKVDYLMSLPGETLEAHPVTTMESDIICHTIGGKPIRPKTLGQKAYVDAIRKNMIVFGTGPAGTGKTYLAMAMAITALKTEKVKRIILTRPAIEAGEKLGFLPGDLQQKIDPYLRPLYDALYEIMGQEAFQRNLEKGAVEVAPLAYMRGRTLDSSFIILDEAQNTTPAQMKMFLTRIGFGSQVVVTGDQTQKDLAPGTVSGLDVARRVLRSIDGIVFSDLTGKDVVRHPLVQKIVEAYEVYEKKKKLGRKAGKK